MVYESFDWDSGVFVGSIMSSETTAAASGQVGVLRHDPMAMLPFCGYDMGKYFEHWIEMGKELGDKAPKIFNVNWFRTDENGNFIWPGFGENLRVLEWILKRCENKVEARKTPIGYLPFSKDINLEGLDLDYSDIDSILEFDSNLWKKEVVDIKSFYNKFGNTLPNKLTQKLDKIDIFL